jgi:hypothetical protein
MSMSKTEIIMRARNAEARAQGLLAAVPKMTVFTPYVVPDDLAAAVARARKIREYPSRLV